MKDDIYYTQNEKNIIKLENSKEERVAMAKSLFGIIPDDITIEEVQEERLKEI